MVYGGCVRGPGSRPHPFYSSYKDHDREIETLHPLASTPRIRDLVNHKEKPHLYVRDGKWCISFPQSLTIRKQDRAHKLAKNWRLGIKIRSMDGGPWCSMVTNKL